MAQENVVEQLLSMDDLIKRVPYYKKRPIYFGVASWKESAIKSLEARGIGEGHHVDQAMQEQGIALVKVFYTHQLNSESVCKLKQELIKKYGEYYHCLNTIYPNDSDISDNHGIVYCRIYKVTEPFDKDEIVFKQQLTIATFKQLTICDCSENPIYFGVASWTGSAKESLEARGIGEKHHVDQAMQEQGIALVKVFYTHQLTKVSVGLLKKELIEKYEGEDYHCLNTISSNDSGISGDYGIVYCRFYQAAKPFEDNGIAFEQLTRAALKESIPQYKYKKNPIYFGVASWKESAIKSLEARGIGGGHHVDDAMLKQGTALVKVLYTHQLTKKSVCKLEQELIGMYKDNKDYKCLNKNCSNDSCIRSDFGIVYFRIYKE